MNSQGHSSDSYNFYRERFANNLETQEFSEAEGRAKGQRLGPDLIRQIADHYAEHIDPVSDMRGSAWYRKQMAQVFVRRAIEQAMGSYADGGSDRA